MTTSDPRLDPRAWLIWAIAAFTPPLLSRNPVVLLMVLVAVLGVRAAWSPHVAQTLAWSGIVRLAVTFALIGMLFNVLTVHIGDQVFARLPTSWPIIGGPFTVNALVYGLLTGLALLTLVLIGTTLGMVLDWPALLRLLPPRLTPVAVAGSVAWAFLPQTAIALREIREARSARGYRGTGPAAFVSLLVPLLSGGLERALMLAEAMEARGFGATRGHVPTREPWRGWLLALGLTAAIFGGYLFAAGNSVVAWSCLATGAVCFAVASRGSATHPRPTRFRTSDWGQRETAIATGAAVAMIVTAVTFRVNPGLFAYDPYPSLTLPAVSLPLVAALGALLIPAFAVPAGPRHEMNPR